MISRPYVALLLSCAGSQTTTHGAAMPLQRAVTTGTARVPGNVTVIPTVRSSYMQHFARSCARASGVNAHSLRKLDCHYSGVAQAFMHAFVRPKLHLRDTREREPARTRRDAVLRLGWNLGRVPARLQSMHAFQSVCVSSANRCSCCCCVHSGCASPPPTVMHVATVHAHGRAPAL